MQLFLVCCDLFITPRNITPRDTDCESIVSASSWDVLDSDAKRAKKGCSASILHIDERLHKQPAVFNKVFYVVGYFFYYMG